MNDFEPRTYRPEYGNPYYNRSGHGGFNPCIVGNRPKGAGPLVRTGYPGLDVLPNCTGYVTGRFNEVIGENNCRYFGDTYAYLYLGMAKKQGLQISDHPTLGGVMVWSGGANTGLGHVACIERVYDDGSVLTSESEWNGLPFICYHRREGSDHKWRAGCYWMDSTYKFLGFVMNPAVGDITMTQNEWNTHMSAWLTEQKLKPAHDYAKTALEWAKELGIMLGDETGNQMPQGLMTREDFAVMLMRYDGRE